MLTSSICKICYVLPLLLFIVRTFIFDQLMLDQNELSLKFEGFIYPYQLYKVIQTQNSSLLPSIEQSYILKIVSRVSQKNQNTLEELIVTLPQQIIIKAESQQQFLKVVIMADRYLIIEKSLKIQSKQAQNKSVISNSSTIIKTDNQQKHGEIIKNIHVYQIDINWFTFSVESDKRIMNEYDKKQYNISSQIPKLLKYQMKSSFTIYNQLQQNLWDIGYNGTNFKIITYQSQPKQDQEYENIDIQNQLINSNQIEETIKKYYYPKSYYKLRMAENRYIFGQKHKSEYQLFSDSLSQDSNIKYLSLITDIHTGSYYLLLGNEAQFSIFEASTYKLALKIIKKFINHNINIYSFEEHQSENLQKFITVNQKKINKYDPITHMDKLINRYTKQNHFAIVFNQQNLAILAIDQKGSVYKKCQKQIITRIKPEINGIFVNTSYTVLSIDKIGDYYIGTCNIVSILSQQQFHINIERVQCHIIDSDCNILKTSIVLEDYHEQFDAQWSYSYHPLYDHGQQLDNLQRVDNRWCKQKISVRINNKEYIEMTPEINCIEFTNLIQFNETNNYTVLKNQDQKTLEMFEQNWFPNQSFFNSSNFIYYYMNNLMARQFSKSITDKIGLEESIIKNILYAPIYNSSNFQRKTIQTTSQCQIYFQNDNGINPLKAQTDDSVLGTISFKQNWKLCKIFLQTNRPNIIIRYSSQYLKQIAKNKGQSNQTDNYKLYHCTTNFSAVNPKCYYDIKHDLKNTPLLLRDYSPNLIYLINQGNSSLNLSLTLIDINSQEIQNVLTVSYTMALIFVSIFIAVVASMILKKLITLLLIYFNIISPNDVHFTYPLNYWELKIKLNQMVNEKLIKFEVCNKQRAEEDCCFCLQTMEQQKYLAQFYCNHFFHKSCVQEWIRQQKNVLNCPMCKRKLNRAGKQSYYQQSMQVQGQIQEY